MCPVLRSKGASCKWRQEFAGTGVAKPPAPLPRLLRPRSNFVGRRQSDLAPIDRTSSGFIIGSKRSGSGVGSVDLVGAMTLVDRNA